MAVVTFVVVFNFYFKIIVHSYIVARNNTEIPCTLCPVSPNGNILQNYSAIV